MLSCNNDNLEMLMSLFHGSCLPPTGLPLQIRVPFHIQISAEVTWAETRETGQMSDARQNYQALFQVFTQNATNGSLDSKHNQPCRMVLL